MNYGGHLLRTTCQIQPFATQGKDTSHAQNDRRSDRKIGTDG